MSAAVLGKAGFSTRVGGHPAHPSTECTCDAGKSGPNIDLVVISAAAAPFFSFDFACFKVPWKTHCGLEILRSTGTQLIQRALVLPTKPPQVARPTTRPTEGSKSQAAKAQA
eukprot:4690040-Pyramimonas_sp.AAC.1